MTIAIPTLPTVDRQAIDANAITYGTLKQTHPDYDGALLGQLEDLYVGGYRIVRKAKDFLSRLANESDGRYAERCGTASYQPYFGQIVDQFVSDLFGQPLSIKPAADADNPNTPGEVPDVDFYSSFEKDVDLDGTSFVDLMERTLRTGLKKRYALVAVDAPSSGDAPPPASMAEEVDRGSRRCYAYEVPLEQLIDWKLIPGGRRFEWAILNKLEQDRPSPFTRRSAIKETFTVWGLSDTGGAAQWRRYAITYDKDRPPKPDDPLSLEDEGVSSFKRIPLLRFELPEGLWVGNKIGPQAREHYQRRSALISAENRSLVAIPVAKKGPEAPAAGGAIPADITQKPTRGNNPVGRFNAEGWLEIGSEDSVEFVEPRGGCYELVDKQLDALKDAMFAVNHQMAASIRPTGAALGRSGLSKQKDQDATERVLRALGHRVRTFAVCVYDAISEARGEDTHWTPFGLDNYEKEDREQLLEESISLDQVQIPSATFRKLHKRYVAEKFLKGIDPQSLATVVQEIEDGVDDEEELRGLMRDAQKDAIQNPQPPAVPSVKQPGVKVPAAKTPVVPKPGDKAA